MTQSPETVWITGASSGIGAALSLEFAQRGFTVVMVARRAEALGQLKTSLPGNSHRIIAVDVTDHERFVAQAKLDMESYGVPSIVVANAGISKGTQVEYPEDYAKVAATLETNVTAMFTSFAAFAGAMKTRGSGTLVGISSVAGVRGLPGSAAYSASKAAATSLCESIRVELHGSGVKVVTIAPGFIATPMTAQNPYKMPFLMPVAVFAKKTCEAILAQTSYKVIPWQMGLVAKILRSLPNWLYDRLLARAGRKPR